MFNLTELVRWVELPTPLWVSAVLAVFTIGRWVKRIWDLYRMGRLWWATVTQYWSAVITLLRLLRQIGPENAEHLMISVDAKSDPDDQDEDEFSLS